MAAVLNIPSASPMVTTLDALLEAFHPPDRERDRDKRPAPLDKDLADRERDAGREARQSTRLRKGMPTQEWRGPRTAAVHVTAFVKQNGPLPTGPNSRGTPQSTTY